MKLCTFFKHDRIKNENVFEHFLRPKSTRKSSLTVSVKYVRQNMVWD